MRASARGHVTRAASGGHCCPRRTGAHAPGHGHVCAAGHQHCGGEAACVLHFKRAKDGVAVKACRIGWGSNRGRWGAAGMQPHAPGDALAAQPERAALLRGSCTLPPTLSLAASSSSGNQLPAARWGWVLLGQRVREDECRRLRAGGREGKYEPRGQPWRPPRPPARYSPPCRTARGAPARPGGAGRPRRASW